MNSLKTRFWIKQDNSFEYPEKTLTDIYQRPNIGVCFSGGGTRAMSAAMGQMRALNSYALFPHIRYISCVSGGSWASTIFCYYNQGAVDDNDLLGPVTPPGSIDQNHLDTSLTSSRLAYGAKRWLVRVILEWEFRPDFKYTTNDVWIYSIGETYLKHFGLFDADSAKDSPHCLPYYSWDQNTVDTIKSENPSLQAATFYTSRPNRPYLIVNSCILLPQHKPSQEYNVNFEYTPLTVGRSALAHCNGGDYGCGFIEPFAFRSVEPVGSGPWTSGNYVTVSGQDRPFTLVDTTGTSSSAFAEEIVIDFSIERFDPKVFYFPVKPSGELLGGHTYFGDGGILENLGIIPLLLRGVKTIFAFINTETKLSLDYCPTDNPADLANNPDKLCDASLPALFGYSNKCWAWHYPNNKVFPSLEFPKLIKKLQEQKRNKLPLIVAGEYQVSKNDSWGVAASDEPVTVIWFYLDRCEQWEKALTDSKISNEIVAGNKHLPSGPYQNFPNYRTINQNDFDLVALSEQQIVLLADFACGTMLWNDNLLYCDAVKAASK